ncbi:MAG: ribbon-helix-helix domain-containing protein [Methanomethylophilus sp.]|jgi:Arc/MetJ-type ribon-helix-helix transcriptional regulator
MEGESKLTVRIPSDDLALIDSLVDRKEYASRNDLVKQAVKELLAHSYSEEERREVLQAAAEAERHDPSEFSDGDPSSELAAAYRESLERKR